MMLMAWSAFVSCIAAVVLLAACASSDLPAEIDSNPNVSLSDCERERLAAALGLSDAAELSLPLDPSDESLADIARDVCARSDAGASAGASSETGTTAGIAALSPAEQRNAALPASLVRGPARFNPTDAPPGDDPYLDGLWVACGQGSASSCNTLLFEASTGSDYEAFAFSCGGRENLDCNVLLSETGTDVGVAVIDAIIDFGPDSPAPASIPELDGWWEACGGGSARACAQLVLSAPGGSAYASFGWTCGGRTTRDCVLTVGDDGSPPALAGRSPDDPPPGDDEYLDQLWQRCGAAEAVACRDLATFGTPGSDYERYALSCGWRAVRACTRLFAELASQQ